MDGTNRRAGLQRLLKGVRAAYMAGLAVIIVWVVRSRWTEVAELLRGARPVLIAASLASSFGMIWIGAWFWTVSLRIQGCRAASPEVFGKALLAASRSLLARYIPGSVWFAVGRVGLLRRAGLPLGPLSATAVLEMATSLTVVIISGLAVLGVSGAAPGGAAWMITLALVLLAAASPALSGRVAAWWAARRGVEFSLTWRGYMQLIAVNVVFWGWSALTFLLYLRAFPSADPYRTALVTGGFLLTWGAGFLAPFAPQGIGVFEVSMTAVLSAEAVAGTAVVLGGYRLVLLARDLIAAPAAELVAARRARRGPDPRPGLETPG